MTRFNFINYSLVIIFLIVTQSYSQTKKVEITESSVVNAKNVDFKNYIGKVQSHYYAAIRYSEGVSIVKLDEKMKIVKSAPVKMQALDKYEMIYATSFALKGKIYLFSFPLVKKGKNRKIYMQTVDPNTLQLNDDRKQVQEFMSEPDFGDELRFSFSPDSSKVLSYCNYLNKDENKEKYNVVIFDNNMNVLAQNEIALAYKANFFKLHTMGIYNDGSFYLLGMEFFKKQKIQYDFLPVSKHRFYLINPVNKYHLLIFNKDIVQQQDNEIAMENDKYIKHLNFTYADNGDLYGAGFYSGYFDSEGIKGYCFLKKEAASKQITPTVFKEYSQELIVTDADEWEKDLIKSKTRKDEAPELYKYRFYDLKLIGNNLVLLAEQYHMFSAPNSPNFYYNFDDILITKINPSTGELVWAGKVDKHQMTPNDKGKYSSFVYGNDGNNLYFLFNEDPANYQKDAPKFQVANVIFVNGVSIIKAELTADGKVNKEILKTVNNTDIIIMPVNSMQTKSKELLIYGQKIKESAYQFIGVKF